MATEVLAVPEEHLADVIKVIRRGLEASPDVAPDVREQLTKWANEEADYIGMEQEA